MFKDVVKQFSSRHIFHYHKYIRWSTDNLISREKNYIVKLQKTLSGYVIIVKNASNNFLVLVLETSHCQIFPFLSLNHYYH